MPSSAHLCHQPALCLTQVRRFPWSLKKFFFFILEEIFIRWHSSKYQRATKHYRENLARCFFSPVFSSILAYHGFQSTSFSNLSVNLSYRSFFFSPWKVAKSSQGLLSRVTIYRNVSWIWTATERTSYIIRNISGTVIQEACGQWALKKLLDPGHRQLIHSMARDARPSSVIDALRMCLSSPSPISPQ